jgi:hypothetical protein
VSILVKSFCLSYHHRVHLVRSSNPHNQIYSSRIGNDNINQRWHQLIKQCQLIGKKIIGKVATWCEFVHAKYETPSLLWWTQKDPRQHCEMQSVPHGSNEKIEFSLDPKVDHKCIESTWKLKNRGSSTWCTTQSKKYLGLMERWNNLVSKKPSSSTPKLAHDFKCTQCESRTMSKMMLEKEWLCNLSEMFS